MFVLNVRILQHLCEKIMGVEEVVQMIVEHNAICRASGGITAVLLFKAKSFLAHTKTVRFIGYTPGIHTAPGTQL